MGTAISVLGGPKSGLSPEGKKWLNEKALQSRHRLSVVGNSVLDKFVESCSIMADTEMKTATAAKLAELFVMYPQKQTLLIPLDKFLHLGRMPRCPNDVHITCTLDSIDRNNSFLIFVSHCWLRGHPAAEGWRGDPHPDNLAGDKYHLCARGIEMLKRDFAPRVQNCYIWLDFGCINQDGNPAGELEQLDLLVQCCDCIFTPIVDTDHEQWSLSPEIHNIFYEYKAKPWNDGPHAYLNRGWCRVEMMYAASIPVQNNSNHVQRHTLFEGGLSRVCAQSRRPHFLYGTKEYALGRRPLMLPPLQHTYFRDYHPLKGNLSVAADAEHIKVLIEKLKPYMQEDQRQAE